MRGEGVDTQRTRKQKWPDHTIVRVPSTWGAERGNVGIRRRNEGPNLAPNDTKQCVKCSDGVFGAGEGLQGVEKAEDRPDRTGTREAAVGGDRKRPLRGVPDGIAALLAPHGVVAHVFQGNYRKEHSKSRQSSAK